MNWNRRTVFWVVGLCCVLSFALFALMSMIGSKLGMDEDMKARIVEGMLKVSTNVAESSRLCSNGVSKQLLIDSYAELNVMLNLLGSGNNLKSDSSKLAAANTDVCQERYTADRSKEHFPYLDKGAFVIERCPDVPEFHTLLTLVYNFVHYDAKYFDFIPKIFQDVNKLYPQLHIIAAIPSALHVEENEFRDVQLITFEESVAEPDIWNKLTAKVTTKYVYIGRNVVHFTWFDRLERLVGEINNLEASVVASAYRALKGGQWSNGCEQSVLSNYMLVYRHGYEVSMQECLVCHHVHGPFVAKTKLLRKTPLPSYGPSTSAFAIWFIQLKKLNKSIVSCPDSMSFVTDESRLPTTKDGWKSLASELQVEVIRPASDQTFRFSCEEANTGCKNTRAVGKALSMCCMEELSAAVQLVMSKCDEAGLLCQLQAGTLLGAVKFNSVLSWELDADIIIHSNNFTAFGDKFKKYFTNLGYKWVLDDGPTSYNIYTAHWKVEMFQDDFMDIETFIHEGISATVIDFDGVNLRTTGSPGLHARNRYGREIYQHVQHWVEIASRQTDDFYGSAFKKFSRCPTPGHHACLDQFIPDGNLIFQIT